jgi:hypothetical protein
MTDQLENAESTEPTLIAEPAENNETIDPAEPTDRIDPADPMLRMEPAEPMLRIDPADPIDKIEPAGPLVRADCHELIDRDPRWLRRIPAFSHSTGPRGAAMGACWPAGPRGPDARPWVPLCWRDFGRPAAARLRSRGPDVTAGPESSRTLQG